MHCTRPCTPYASASKLPMTSAHCALSFGTLAAVRSITLRSCSLARYDSSAEDRPDDDSDLSRTSTATGHKKRLDDNSDLGRTRTATEHRKHSSSQTVVQREERLAAEKFRHIPFFITSSYYTCTFPYTPSAYCQYIHAFRVSLLCYYSSFKFMNCCMVEVRDMCLRIAYTWL